VEELKQQQQVMLQQHQQMNQFAIDAKNGETARANKAEEELLRSQDQVKALQRERERTTDGSVGADGGQALRQLPAQRAEGTSTFSDPLDDSVSQRDAVQKAAAAAAAAAGSDGFTVIQASSNAASAADRAAPGSDSSSAAGSGSNDGKASHGSGGGSGAVIISPGASSVSCVKAARTAAAKRSVADAASAFAAAGHMAQDHGLDPSAAILDSACAAVASDLMQDEHNRNPPQ
jgi:hypothetical protein